MIRDLRKVRFQLEDGGGGGEITGASERRVISKSFTNWGGGGQTCFVRRQRRVTLFSARKKVFHVASVKSTLKLVNKHAQSLKKLAFTSKATSQDQSKLFTGDEKILTVKGLTAI